MEVGSDRTRHIDLEEKPTTYSQHVKAAEYCYADPPDPESRLRELRLWRLGPEGYLPVAPEPSGRLRSAVLGVEFGWDEADFLRIWVDGEPQPTHEEETERRQKAEAQAGEESLRRQEAEARAEAEARQRQEAEALAQAEAGQRAEEAARRLQAEARAAEEAARRQELERQLAELRARIDEQ
jgi:hypothetical protein